MLICCNVDMPASCLQHRVDRSTPLEETFGELKVGACQSACPASWRACQGFCTCQAVLQ